LSPWNPISTQKKNNNAKTSGTAARNWASDQRQQQAELLIDKIISLTWNYFTKHFWPFHQPISLPHIGTQRKEKLQKLIVCRPYQVRIRALSAHSAAEFNILPGRWQHLWLVAIVPPKRWGKMDRNESHTAWGNFKTLISSLYHYKNYA
jgi:hypothetical protein